jgi:hypothetical protein
MRFYRSVFLCFFLLPVLAISADGPKPDPWAAVRFLVGRWEGTSEGEPGRGAVVRRYEFVLDERFIHERNMSTYAPQKKNEEAEMHEHWSFISYDRARKLLVLRQFHEEGFVNQYVQAPGESSTSRLVFESESLENLDSRWRARETYDVLGPDEFTETFELAEPGKPFQVYSKNHFKRAAREL